MLDAQLIKDAMRVYNFAKEWLEADPYTEAFNYDLPETPILMRDLNLDEAYTLRCLNYLRVKKLVDLAGEGGYCRVLKVYPLRDRRK